MRVPWPSMDAIEAVMVSGTDVLEALDRLLKRPAWQADALCREYPEVNFFPERGEDTRPAKSICRRCSVREECETFALDDPDALKSGIWGGTSATERKVLRQQRPKAPVVCVCPCGAVFEAQRRGAQWCEECKLKRKRAAVTASQRKARERAKAA